MTGPHDRNSPTAARRATADMIHTRDRAAEHLAEMAASLDNAGTRLVAALTAAGFTTAGRGRGYVRMGWPGTPEPRGNLRVPTDDRYADYPALLAAALGELGDAARRGEAATRALNLHRKETP